MKIMKVHSEDLRRKDLNIPFIVVPMELFDEDWAHIIHGQSLDRLNERGGLGVNEMLLNIHRKRYYEIEETTQRHVDELNAHILKFKRSNKE